MATPKVYVICDQNCKFESMTKEQILSAIIQAVEGGTIGDVDTGFITSVKSINGQTLRFFYGEQSAYDTLSAEEKENLVAVITNDAQMSGILEELQRIAEKADGAVAIAEGAVAKSGDTMSGTLQLPYLRVCNWNNYPSIAFVPANSNENAGGLICHNADTQRIMIVSCFNTDQDGAAERFGEYFRFPAPSAGNTSAKWYNVLTSKNVVTVAQGGTGADNPAGARKNLGVPYNSKQSTEHNTTLGSNSTHSWVIYCNEDGSTINKMDLWADKTSFDKPVTVASGGTGGTTPKEARENLEVPSVAELENAIDKFELELKNGFVMVKNAKIAQEATTAKHADDAEEADNAAKVNNLEIKRDASGVLKIGDTIIPQKKLLWSGDHDTNNASTPFYTDTKSLEDRVFEVYTSVGIFKFKNSLNVVAQMSVGNNGFETNSLAMLVVGIFEKTKMFINKYGGQSYYSPFKVTKLYEIIE